VSIVQGAFSVAPCLTLTVTIRNLFATCWHLIRKFYVAMQAAVPALVGALTAHAASLLRGWGDGGAGGAEPIETPIAP
jgi:hypothetical protein